MRDLSSMAERVGALLAGRGETVALAESASGGLVSAALLAVPGASAYYLGGGVIYTAAARSALLGVGEAEMAGLRSATEPYADLLARTVRARLGATWGLAETGAAGPSPNRYGDPAGHACLAVDGPVRARLTVATGAADRAANMRAFAASLMELFFDTLERAPGARA